MFTGKRPAWRSLSITTDEEPDRDFGVFAPNAPMPESYSPRRTSLPEVSVSIPPSQPNDLLLRLSRLKPESEDQKQQIATLLGQLAPLVWGAEQLESAIRNQRHERLIEEHRAIRAEGRTAQRELQKRQQILSECETEFMNAAALQEEVTNKLKAMRQLEAEGRHLSRFYSDSDLAEWENLFAVAQEVVRNANERAADAAKIRNQAQADMLAAQQEVSRVAAHESRIRGELGEEPFFDPALGLATGNLSVATPEAAASVASSLDL